MIPALQPVDDGALVRSELLRYLVRASAPDADEADEADHPTPPPDAAMAAGDSAPTLEPPPTCSAVREAKCGTLRIARAPASRRTDRLPSRPASHAGSPSRALRRSRSSGSFAQPGHHKVLVDTFGQSPSIVLRRAREAAAQAADEQRAAAWEQEASDRTESRERESSFCSSFNSRRGSKSVASEKTWTSRSSGALSAASERDRRREHGGAHAHDESTRRGGNLWSKGLGQLLPLTPLSPAEAMGVLHMRETLRGDRARLIVGFDVKDDAAARGQASRPTGRRPGLEMMTARGEALAASLGKLEGKYKQALLVAAQPREATARGARNGLVTSFAESALSQKPGRLKRRGSTWAGAAPGSKPQHQVPAAALRRRNTLHSISAVGGGAMHRSETAPPGHRLFGMM